MPMWISWVNPHTQKRERVYNFFDRDSPQGTTAIELAKKHLSIRFSTSAVRPGPRFPLFAMTATSSNAVGPGPDVLVLRDNTDSVGGLYRRAAVLRVQIASKRGSTATTGEYPIRILYLDD